MNIGQVRHHSAGRGDLSEPFKPFARPRLKRRRITPSKPAFFGVRPNPSHYVFNFSEHCRSIENAICSLVESDRRIISVVGLPGIGKSVLLRGVAYHPKVYACFPDGICLVQLQHDTTVQSLIQTLSDILTKIGGTEDANQAQHLVTKENDANAAIQLIRHFLSRKRFLLLLDNLCAATLDVAALLTRLIAKTPTASSGRFTVISSTRSVDVAQRFGKSVLHLHLYDPCGEVARNILCAHAGFDCFYLDSKVSQQNSSVTAVLRKCSGLPLALAVAGGAIKRLLEGTNNDKGRDMIWKHYTDYLLGNFRQFGEISGLFKALTACTQTIKSNNQWHVDISVEDVTSSLGIVTYGRWISYAVLQRLWALKQEDVAAVVRQLSKLCLVSQEVRRGASGILIPDVIIEYCRYVAMASGGLGKWHAKMILAFAGNPPGRATEGKRNRTSKDATRKFGFDEDQYIRDCSRYHLDGALSAIASTDSTEASLLKDAYEYIQKRIEAKYDRSLAAKE